MSSSSSSSADPLNNRVDFRLHAARTHLHNLKRLEAINGSLASSSVRLQAEIELDEFLYHLVGVKDALLQEINCKLHLGFAREEVKVEAINKELEQKLGVAAKKALMTSISKMQSNKKHPLGRINELHSHSKHRAMLDKEIVTVDGRISRFALIDQRTRKGMETKIIDYLIDSYIRVEKLQKMVRDEIRKYCANI